MPLTRIDPTPFRSILSEFKVIPSYQRDFVWDQSLIENFVQNLIEAFNQGRGESYFTGAMVLSQEEGRDYYELVDGQQRATVTYMLLIQTLGMLKESGQLSNQDIDFVKNLESDLIATNHRQSDGSYEKRLKLKHLDSAIESYLESLVDGNGVGPEDEPPEASNVTVQNLFQCARTIKNVLEEHLLDSNENAIKVNESLSFIEFILDKVQVIHFVAESRAQALLIYSRLNASGKKLGTLEIVKGLLFAKVESRETEWEKLETKWLEFWSFFNTPIKVAGRGSQVSLIDETQFLTYFFFVFHNKAVKDETGVADGFLSTSKINDFILSDYFNTFVAARPLAFVEKLLKFAKSIHLLRTADTTDASIRPLIEDIALISRAQTQPLLFLLPAADNPDLLKAALNLTLRHVFIFSIFLTGSGTASKVWRHFGNRLMDLRSQESDQIEKVIPRITDIADSRFHLDWDEFSKTVRSLSFLVGAQKNKIKSILQMTELSLSRLYRLEKHESMGDFYQQKGVDIDHISPRSNSTLSEELVNSIGNTTLLERNYNRAIKDTLFEEVLKREKFRESSFLITKGLVNASTEGDGARGQALDCFTTILAMNDETCKQRTSELLAVLAHYFRLDAG